MSENTLNTSHIVEKSPEKNVYPRMYLAEIGPEKVEFVLDSGANEFMLSKADLVASLDGRRTKISRRKAGGEKFSGVFGTPKVFLFPDGTEIKLSKAVFSEGLSDNLASVGRLCEAGFSVLFEEGSTEFLNQV